MPCYHPQDVVRSKRVCHPKSGKPVSFFGKSRLQRLKFFNATPRHTDFYAPEEFQVPGCKPKCVGCQEDYARQWAVRCWHESKMHDENCFITLTYNDKFVSRGLDYRYFQLFMKRFRRSVGQAKRVSFYMAGEMGSQTGRPHFHACIFGFDFPDRKLYTVRNDIPLYTSEMLSGLWSDPKTKESFGFSTVGDVTFASASYIARYIGKKAHKNEGEFVRMSLKCPSKSGKPGGIGKGWFDAYKDSVFPEDAVTFNDGGRCKPPRYYDKAFELTDPVSWATISQVRKDRARNSPDNTPERLRVREKVKQAQFRQLKRSL